MLADSCSGQAGAERCCVGVCAIPRHDCPIPAQRSSPCSNHMPVLHSTTLPRSHLHSSHHSFSPLQGLGRQSTIKTSVDRAFCPCSHSLETGNYMAVEEVRRPQICSASPLQVLPRSAVPRCTGYLPTLPAGISSPEQPVHCFQPRRLLPAQSSGHSPGPQPVPTSPNKDIAPDVEPLLHQLDNSTRTCFRLV